MTILKPLSLLPRRAHGDGASGGRSFGMTMSVLTATLSLAHLGMLHPAVSVGLQCPAPFFRARGLSAVAASSVLLPHTAMQLAQGPSAFAEPRARPVRMGLISKARGGVNLAVLAFFVALLASRIDPVVLALNLLGGALKLAWRLIAFGLVVRVLLKPAAGMLFRMGVGIVMAGGPIRALQSSFFGTMARIFAALASFFSRRGSSFSGAADMFGRLAQGCDDRRPAGAGMGGLGGNLADFFGGAGGANPYGGVGVESLLGQGSDFFGGAPRSATLDDNLFGGSAPLSGGGIQPKATPAPSAPESAPRDVTIKVRRPGEARRAGGMPTSSSYSEYRRAAPSRTSDDIGSAPYPPSTSSGDFPCSDRISTSSGSADAIIDVKTSE